MRLTTWPHFLTLLERFSIFTDKLYHNQSSSLLIRYVKTRQAFQTHHNKFSFNSTCDISLPQSPSHWKKLSRKLCQFSIRALKQIILSVLSQQEFSPSKYLNQFSLLIINNFPSLRVRNLAVEQTSNYWIKDAPFLHAIRRAGFIEFSESAKTFNDPHHKIYWNNFRNYAVRNINQFH